MTTEHLFSVIGGVEVFDRAPTFSFVFGHTDLFDHPTKVWRELTDLHLLQLRLVLAEVTEVTSNLSFRESPLA